MKKLRIWKATDDERILAESGKIYRIGFWVLAAGVGLDVLIKLALYLPGYIGTWGVFPLVGMEGIVLAAALVLCALLAAGRGILTVGANPEAERFPLKHYALASLVFGLGLGVLGLALRMIFYPYWEGDLFSMILLLGVLLRVIGGVIFLVCLTTFYLMFRLARRRRRRLEKEADPEER